MMNKPLYTVNSGNISGAIWKMESENKSWFQPSIKKPRKTKDGNYVKDEDGKQQYTDFYSKNDLKDISFVAIRLYTWIVDNNESPI